MVNKKRLIDANAVDYENIMCSLSQLRWLNAIIEAQPTVDAVEVVHGEWAIVGDACVCSVCNKWAVQDYHYCPNCGAKMDGDGNG